MLARIPFVQYARICGCCTIQLHSTVQYLYCTLTVRLLSHFIQVLQLARVHVALEHVCTHLPESPFLWSGVLYKYRSRSTFYIYEYSVCKGF